MHRRNSLIKPFTLALCLSLVISIQLANAIVKQQPQQQQAQQQSQQQQPQVSSSSAAAPSPSSSSSASSTSQSQQASSGISQALDGQQQTGAGQAAFSPYTQAASSSGPSSSSGSSPLASQSMQASSSPFVGLSSAMSGSGKQSNAASQQPSSANYYDQMGASASEQSYQAAANTVNLALAQSGLFSNYPSVSSSSSASGSGQQQASGSAADNQQQQQAAPSQQYQPVHYLYYPAGKDSSGNKLDAYQSASQYPAYPDQFAAQLGNVASQPDVAASSQDPSYLAPGMQDGSAQSPNMYQAGSGQQQQQNQQQQQMNGNSYPDLGAYANQLNPVQMAPNQPNQQPQQAQPHLNSGSVQFQQSNSNQQQQGAQPQQQHHSSSSSNANANNNNQMQADFMSQSPSQYQANQQGVQGSLFSQMGDLYTSNYGSPSVSSNLASYMSPNGQQANQLGQQQQAQQQQHHQANPGLASMVDQFGAAQQASNLIPNMNQFHQQQQQQQQQQPTSGQQQSINGQQQQSNNIFNSAAYLNSLLQSPQFASQFAAATGQQPDAALHGGMMASGSGPAASSVAPSAAAASKKFGLGSLVMPMLALAGLSLLIPTMSNIGTAVGRKKRSISESDSKSSLIERQQQILYEGMNGLANQLAKESAIGEYLERIERYYSLYKNAAQNDDCMNRLICEFGDSVKDISGKSAVITIIEKLVPDWMVGKVHLFKEAAMDAKEGREKCKRYTCHHDKKSTLH